MVLVLLGDGDDEAQIGSGHLIQGSTVAPLDRLGELYLLLYADELLATYLLQVAVERGTLSIGDGLRYLELSHSVPFYLLMVKCPLDVYITTTQG